MTPWLTALGFLRDFQVAPQPAENGRDLQGLEWYPEAGRVPRAGGTHGEHQRLERDTLHLMIIIDLEENLGF